MAPEGHGRGMDDSGSWSENSSQDASLPPSGKKAKGKAPLPPGEARYSDRLPSVDSADTVQYNMDQKENIDQDIELKVVLPDDRLATTIVHGSKPMMDLLVFLCGQYHLNPSTYTIDVISADKTQLKFKPNTPIGMLEVERVVLKSKNVDEKNKKPGPSVPEQTVRVVINYRRTQKTVMRVSPFVPLRDLLPSICNKCEFDPRSTVLLQDYQSQKHLNLLKSLNDLGVRELYAMDHSKATSPTEIRPPPLQESFQNVEIKQNDEKGFFNFFRRSTKKKRDQTSSAPATPLLHKPRPQNVMRANTVTKSYDTNTMPSDVPKKRRAPLPPMHPPQNGSNEIHRAQIRTSSCIVKSVSMDESEKTYPGVDRSRTGSFQHSGTSSFNSSLRRTKRKAPPPPSPPPKSPSEVNDENSNRIAVSEEINHEEAPHDDQNLHVTSPTAHLISEPELQEIEEREELSVSLKEEADSICKENVNGSTKEEISLSSSEEHSDGKPAATDKSAACDAHSSSVLSDVEEISKITQDDLTADGTLSLFIKDEAATENTTLEYDKIGESDNRTSTPTRELENHYVFETKVVASEQATPTSACVKSTETTDIVTEDSSYIHLTESNVDAELKQSISEKGKMHDSAVQTVNFDSDAEVSVDKEIAHSQEYSLADKVQLELAGQESNPAYLTEQQHRHELVSNVRESMETQTDNIQENIVDSSQSKAFHLYRQHSDPKPKPSNELTRDYLPKVGMTTYKIIPQRSFDVERYGDYEEAGKSVYPSVNEQESIHPIINSNVASHYGQSHEKMEPPSVVKNGDLSPPGLNVNTLSMVSKTTADQSRKEHFALSRSLSSAPVLITDKTSPPEVKPKPKPVSPVKGPSSFYLQMQRRASSMYVTSAIAKAKTSANPSNSTVKIKDLGNEAAQITIRTLPSRVNVLNFPPKIEEKLPEDKPPLPETYSEIKNGGLGTISEMQSEVVSRVNVPQISSEKDPKQRELSHELSFQPRAVELREEKRPEVLTLEQKLLETRNAAPEVSAEKPSLIEQNEWKSEMVSTTSSSKTVQPLISPTSQNPPLTLPKLSNFVTPRPFLSSHSNSFSSSVTSMVKRSQSFNSGTSPTRSPLNLDAPIGWSPVTSPSDAKKDSPVFSDIPQGQTKEKTLTPELKYRVHSPPPVPEKKSTVSFQSSDPEQLRQDILVAIRSGQAAANLKRITIRSNTIAINGKSRISHPVFSETLYED